MAGEVRWEWDGALSARSDTEARVDFPPAPMGTRREQTLFVRNVGRAAFTMAEFAQVSGVAVAKNEAAKGDAVFELFWDPSVVVRPGERVPVTVGYVPPIQPELRVADHEAHVELVPDGAARSLLVLTGRAVSSECDVPAVLDFGSVPLGMRLEANFSIANTSSSTLRVTATEIAGATPGIFVLDGFGSEGERFVDPGASPTATVRFVPTEPRDYDAHVKVRRGESCPEAMLQLKGRGVRACLSWVATPSSDAEGRTLHFGFASPAQTVEGTLEFANACSLPVSLSELRTSVSVFTVTRAAPGDLTKLEVPPATRDPSGTWQPGTASMGLAFTPTELGSRSGTMDAQSSLVSEPLVSAPLLGFGGGPRIELRPSPVFALGRLGFVPGSTPVIQRTLRVANVGSRPTPADPRINLRLGREGQGRPYWTVRTINGSPAELCLGEWDVAGDRCAGTLSASSYDPTVGLEATAGDVLAVPVRVMPLSTGLKEWEVTVHSNDPATPDAVVRITAEAVSAPPCNFTVAPTWLNFGLLDAGESADLEFTLTNLGTAPDEVCYFNGIELTPGSDPTFTLLSATSELELAAGQSAGFTVRALGQAMGVNPLQASGMVTFNVSSPSTPQGAVVLQATVAPSCITASPRPLAFSDTELECGSPDRAVVITNSCSTSVVVNSTRITQGATAPVGSGSCTTPGGCDQFVLTSIPAPGPLGPGQSRTALVRFQPYVTGAHQGQLLIEVQQGSSMVPLTVAISGTGRPRTSQSCGVSAVCPGPITVNANTTVTLTPTVVSPATMSCSWSVGSRPSTSSGTFGTPQSCTGTTYFADVVGTHVVNFDVSDGLGGTAQCSTPITVNPNGDLWIELTWDRPNDMDLHLLHPNAGAWNVASSWGNTTWDCHFRARTPNWMVGAAANPSLDRDDITGMGPENIRIPSPSRAFAHTVGVHMYSWIASPTPVISTVKVYCAGQLVSTRSRAMSGAKNVWVVGTIDFSGGAPCTFTPIDSIVNSVP